MKRPNLIIALALATLTPTCWAAPKSFADNPEVVAFAREMEEKHQFDSQVLLKQFAQLKVNASVLKAVEPPSSPLQRSWERYRPRFVNEVRIENGVQFWQTYQDTIARASAEYGVPPEIIVAIIGVETIYGRNTGGFSVFEALSTLAFHYPRRAEFFRTELEQFLLLTRENKLPTLTVKGSYAGAIGIPQFMPGSQRRYAVDFNGDGRIDLASVDDAIGSVARFLERHGWIPGAPVAVPANLAGEPDKAWIEAGIRPTLKVSELSELGVLSEAPAEETVTLVDLVTPGKTTEYWLGFENFYVITRYNRSSFYAMSVFQLAQAIKQRAGR
ncbi:MAG TPA: lytic murein transglycosylase B [Rhodocyclaceae bacterium]|nr:lytic murein transglycosylase B [Rhodocyclaceae bacterium]